MKKISTITSSLFLLVGMSNINAQGLASNVTPDFKKIDSVVGKTGKVSTVDSAYNFRAVDHRREVKFGLKAGLNKSDVYNGSAETKASPSLGWMAGAFIAIPFSKHFGIQPEIIYAQKGFKAMGTVAGNNYYFKRKTSYIDMPVLLQFKPNECISIFAGPLLSFLINTKDTYEEGSITSEQKQVIKEGVISKNVLGVEAGMDVYIQKIIASFRAGWDLQPLDDNAASNSRRYQNSWVQLSVGYIF